MPRKFEGPLLNDRLISTRKWYQNLPLAYDPDYLVFMDDFTGIALDTSKDWTLLKDGAATVDIATDTQHGEVIFTSQASTNDSGGSIQGNEIYLPTASKELWFEARVKGSTANDMEMYVGLSENFDTNAENVLTASNRIGFQVDDGNASLICKSEATNVETSLDSQKDLEDATYVLLGFHIISNTRIDYFVDRVLVATITTNIPSTEMALALFELSGSASGTRSMTVDYIMCIVQR